MADLEEREIPVTHLQLGMYVCRLDVAWELTSFPIQGLRITSLEDIERLSRYCQKVTIDLARERQLEPIRHATTQPKSTPAQQIKRPKKAVWKRHCVEQHPVTSNIQKELSASAKIMDELERQVYLLCERTLHCRRANVEQLVDSSAAIVESVIRNPDALAWLCRVRKTRKSIHMHTMRLAVWGAIVGRQLGFNRFSLTHLCSALLMTGIGKSSIPEKSLGGYSPFNCSSEYQQHLTETIFHLKQIRFEDDDVTNTLQHYCERIDGSGYPNGMRGSTIPFMSRLCGLIETFELLINPFHHSRAISPSHAIVFLNKYKGTVFEDSLVEEFIKAVGLYPTGSLVELSNGQLGVILTQNYEKRLRASVIPIISDQGEVIEKYRVLDLSYADTLEKVFIRKGAPSNTIPRGLLEDAHHWMLKKNSSIKNLLDSLF